MKEFVDQENQEEQLMILLLKQKDSAKEVADMLQETWDGCNGVILSRAIDLAALLLAVKLAGNTSFCYQGACCPLKENFIACGNSLLRVRPPLLTSKPLEDFETIILDLCRNGRKD